MARLLAQHLQATLGQPIVIDNRPGGGTTIGTKAVAMAAPDGYTLLFSSSSLVIDPALSGKTDYDPLKDSLRSQPSRQRRGSWRWRPTCRPTLEEFVAHAKASPGKLAFGFAQGMPRSWSANASRC